MIDRSNLSSLHSISSGYSSSSRISVVLSSTMAIYQVVKQMIIVVRYRCLLSIICIYSLLAGISLSSDQRHFVTQLIHRDSIFSPYYNPNHTIYDRTELARASSMSRFAFLSSRERNSLSFESLMKDYQVDMLPENSGSLFMARISFGEPPVPQLVAMDTGSSLLWIQCLPCRKCYNQLEDIFDPTKSSTYSNVSCQSPECMSFSEHSCDQINNCIYQVGYMDGTGISGYAAFEQLTIGTSDDGISKLPRVVIGCGHDNNMSGQKEGKQVQFSGILGLGPKPYSLVDQLGKKFSYCIGNINDLSYPFNQLAMGEAARLDGYSTPMYIGANSEYLVTLEGISVGDKRLGVTREAFLGGQFVRGGVMIDSGATFTYLATQGYLALRNEVAVLMDGLLEEVNYDDYDINLCYKGNVGRDLKGFPVTTFHLAEGAELVVDIDGMFRQLNKDTFCMAVIDASRSEGVSIIGILAQQYYNVGYDLEDERIYFQRIDCEVLAS